MAYVLFILEIVCANVKEDTVADLVRLVNFLLWMYFDQRDFV